MSFIHRTSALLTVLTLGCAEVPRDRASEYRVSRGGPEPDMACVMGVQRALLVASVREVAVRVTLHPGEPASVSLLAPEMTPAQADTIRRAFADCLWLPDPTGRAVATVTIGR